MLCLSESSRFKINHPDKERPIFSQASGERIGTRRGLCAEFQPGSGLPLHAQQEALRRFEFKGLPMGLDPMERVGWWDSEVAARENGWTDEEQQRMEEFMRANDGQGFIIYERPLAALPGGLKNYPKLTTIVGRRDEAQVLAKVRELVDEFGMDPDEIVAWELDHPRRESEAIIAEVNRLREEKEGVAEPETVVAA